MNAKNGGCLDDKALFKIEIYTRNDKRSVAPGKVTISHYNLTPGRNTALN